jgi:hypothetical protein
MENDFSQIIKIRVNKGSWDYSVNFPTEFRRVVNINKYMECMYDPATGGILYVPIQRAV